MPSKRNYTVQSLIQWNAVVYKITDRVTTSVLKINTKQLPAKIWHFNIKLQL